MGWFNPQDGYFEVAAHSKIFKAATNVGPIWVILGEKDDDLLISVNMVNVGTTPKKYVRLLGTKD